MKKLLPLGLLFFSTMTMGSEIIFSKAVNSSHKSRLQNDLAAVKAMKFSSDTPARTLEVLGIPELNNESAYQWIIDRIGYIVENQDVTNVKNLIERKIINVERNDISYYGILNSKKMEAREKELEAELSNKTRTVVVMSNIGTAIYNWGKLTNTLFSFNMNEGMFKKKSHILVKSPRTGIIQIGEGLFMRNKIVNSRNLGAISNSIERLSTIFHEARHSDGNGNTLGFYHKKCPTGHELAGAAACDENLNGPYTVGAVMLTEMVKACGDNCTLMEKEILKASILDSYNRVQKTTSFGTPSTDLDASPESI